MLKITSVRHAFPESQGFVIDRPNGHREYTFIHFYNSVEIKINGRKIITEPHAIILYKPETPQYYKSYEPLIHDWFHFVGEFDSLTLNNFKFDEIYYPKAYNIITETVAELENEFFGDKINRNFIYDSKTKELFVKLDRDIANTKCEPMNTEYVEGFRYLRGEVFSNLKHSWTVSKMARRMGLSESHFYLLYKKIYGITPTADLIKAKIDSARNTLRFQNTPIGEIAANLGYQNTTHFIRQFKNAVGVSPTAYRNEFKNGRF